MLGAINCAVEPSLPACLATIPTRARLERDLRGLGVALKGATAMVMAQARPLPRPSPACGAARARSVDRNSHAGARGRAGAPAAGAAPACARGHGAIGARTRRAGRRGGARRAASVIDATPMGLTRRVSRESTTRALPRMFLLRSSSTRPRRRLFRARNRSWKAGCRRSGDAGESVSSRSSFRRRGAAGRDAPRALGAPGPRFPPTLTAHRVTSRGRGYRTPLAPYPRRVEERLLQPGGQSRPIVRAASMVRTPPFAR